MILSHSQTSPDRLIADYRREKIEPDAHVVAGFSPRLLFSNCDLSQRRVQCDRITAAVEQRLGMRWAKEAVVGYQSPNRPAGSDSVHRKIRNNLLRLERRPLDGRIDGRFEALRHVNGDVAYSRLKIHVKIPIDIIGNHVNKDISRAG